MCAAMKPILLGTPPFSVGLIAWIFAARIDFKLFFTDGHIGIREMILKRKLHERAYVEKLELSRRYWKAQGIEDWKLVMEE